MFGNKKKGVSYEEKIRSATYKRIYQTLKEISTMEIKENSKNGDSLNYEATCKEMKTKARLAIEFVSDLEKDEDDKK